MWACVCSPASTTSRKTNNTNKQLYTQISYIKVKIGQTQIRGTYWRRTYKPNPPPGERTSIPVTEGLSQAHIFLLTLPSSSARAHVQTPSRSMTITGDQCLRLGCQMGSGITLAVWCEGARPSEASKLWVLLISRTSGIRIQIGAGWWEGWRWEADHLLYLELIDSCSESLVQMIVEMFHVSLYLCCSELTCLSRTLWTQLPICGLCFLDSPLIFSRCVSVRVLVLSGARDEKLLVLGWALVLLVWVWRTTRLPSWCCCGLGFDHRGNKTPAVVTCFQWQC